MKPNKEGIWEWIDENNVTRLVYVCDCNKKLREATNDSSVSPDLNVYFWGGYYSIYDVTYDVVDGHGKVVQKDYTDPAEWSDRWGKFVGEHGSVPDDQLYLMPTREQIEKLQKEGRL